MADYRVVCTRLKKIMLYTDADIPCICYIYSCSFQYALQPNYPLDTKVTYSLLFLYGTPQILIFGAMVTAYVIAIFNSFILNIKK